MIPADLDRFTEVFAALSKAFTKPLDAALMAEYFEGLADYPLPLVEAGKRTLVRSSKYFPRVRDWREACDAARPTSGPRLVRPPSFTVNADGDPEATFCCASCQDTGWRPACGCPMDALDIRGECPTHPRTANGLTYRQAMQACACRESNPEFQRTRPRVGRV